MYSFALYALSERFRLRRFAIVHETGIRNFKGLIKCSQNNLRKCNLRNRRTYFRMVLGTEERHWLPHQRQMLPRKCKAVGLCKTSLFFASRTLGTAGTASVDNATPDHLLPQAAISLQIHCYKRTTNLLCRQKEEQSVNIMSMEVIIISKNKYEEMVGKLNRLSDRVNEILRKRKGKRLSRWMDNQEVCQQLRISPRTLQTLRDNGTLAYSQIGHKIFYKPEDVQRIVRLVEDRRKDAAWRDRTI